VAPVIYPHPFRENGARIKRARKRTGLSQELFAVEVGTTRRHMIRLENGEHLPSSALRDRIAERTGQSRDEFQSSDDDEEAALPRRSLSDDLLRLAQVAELMERRPDVIEDILAVEHGS